MRSSWIRLQLIDGWLRDICCCYYHYLLFVIHREAGWFQAICMQQALLMVGRIMK